MWIISMGLIVLFLEALLTGQRTLGWFLFAGGVGAAISTVALAEEVAEVLHRKALAASAAEERTSLKSLSEFFGALRPSRPALTPPVRLDARSEINQVRGSFGGQQMNWRRGLFRLWIVGTALFVLAVAFVSYSEIKAEFDAAGRAPKLVTDTALIKQLEAAPPDETRPFDPDEFLRRYEPHYIPHKPNPWATLAVWASIALGIPLAVLALGSSLVWALSGFAAKRS
jgi:hypothetical protein